ncbi:MAG: hypothetical protein BYD32DRAFT_420723 [Podila humilis]|nr:MAG: hypothetical protein BYD32DRAFT_420723 [Podila humilis]
MSTPSSSKLHHSGPTTTNMLPNKTFLFAVAAAFMALALVEAAPAMEAVQEHAACIPCDDPPPCTLHCPRGYCDINPCTCRPMCKNGIPP